MTIKHQEESSRRDRAMRRAWRRDHPTLPPLPEYLCEWENPFPGYKRECKKLLAEFERWEPGFNQSYFARRR